MSADRTRLTFLCALASLLATPVVGCAEREATGSGDGKLELVWGRRGISDGRLQTPRAITIDAADRLYIVDKTARIQVFDVDGNFLHGWRTPAWQNGKPCGMSFDNAGNLLVADTHYFRMLVYTPEGKLLDEQTIGGVSGNEPGHFNFVTDAVQDSQGNFYISEYGPVDRIQKFSPQREFVCQWGDHGREPGNFMRPQSLAVDEQDRIWVSDACNHRIQVFEVPGDQPRQVAMWGEAGRELGQLQYPYGMILSGPDHLYVSEFGNHRVQKFTREGKFLASWGTPGRGLGQLNSPWALAQDSRGRLHVLDTQNHRVQRIVL